ncbi:MAG: ATP--guanido phosphotransferase [Ruminococcaceae bacterium]|nr:ATP--guanido phosphotransferase [Oscillospiraceae bacterium]
MPWYHTPGKEQDVVVSTRVRLARNIDLYPFVSRLDATTAEELITKIGAVLEEGGFVKTDFQSIPRTLAYSYVEKHYVSPGFVKISLPHALYLNEPCNLSVMLCEEDHIRLQCILPGLSLSEAWEGARRVDELLDESLDFAYDKGGRWGYLTHCPTNLGTAMRASVMMFLPALTSAGQMDELSAQLALAGMTIRGMWGEGSGATGCLYQISNRMTLGITEKEIVDGIHEAVHAICEQERKLRASIKGQALDQMTDKIYRSLGILKYARTLPLKEFTSLLSDVRLGVAMGLLPGIQIHDLTTLFIDAMPATLSLASNATQASDRETDFARGVLVRSRLGEK